ncbi:MAG TPA: ABC transporter permease [Alphaproteobacteria bacterium]|nr:ABC transporter permease [Alphaproteobacteria bacterium]
MAVILGNALADLAAGVRRYRVWVALATEDVGDQHRRTALGPLWMLINYLAFAATFIFIFHAGEADRTYPIYVATGLLVWFFIMETLNSSVTLFVREESLIKGTTLPLSVYVLRATLQAVIRTAYALAGCIGILLLAGAAPGAGWGWAALGLAVVVLTAPAAIICVAFLGVFVPDSQFVVSNLMRVGMFVTPVFWTNPGGGLREAAYAYNPFTYFLEIVRVPILAGDLPAPALALCIGMSILAWTLALLLLGSFRREVALVL